MVGGRTGCWGPPTLAVINTPPTRILGFVLERVLVEQGFLETHLPKNLMFGMGVQVFDGRWFIITICKLFTHGRVSQVRVRSRPMETGHSCILIRAQHSLEVRAVVRCRHKGYLLHTGHCTH